jgi:hypothetical protein
MALKNDNLINELEIKKVLIELGENGEKELDDLRQYLGYPALSGVRFAPSIITRSESLLLGLSPRFAYRFSFSQIPGFVNCRRLRTLINFAETSEHIVWSNSNTQAISKLPKIREILSGDGEHHAHCIADCFLSPPAYLENGKKFEILTTALNVAYGECLHGDLGKFGQFFLGTPYVRHVDLGGGVCAESACFVATTLLQRYARGIYGLAEITAFAHKKASPNLCISGLSLEAIIQYFDSVNLRAIQQMPLPWAINKPILEQKRYLAFASAVKAYLSSKMPVILPVEMARLAGYVRGSDGKFKHVHKHNVYSSGVHRFTPDSKEFTRSPLHSHQLILVGCSKDNDLNNLEIIFHDPGVMPFMKTTARLLASVGRHKDTSTPDREDMLFMPVTPKAVKLPLLAWRKDDREPFNEGLYDIADHTHRTASGRPYPKVAGDQAGNFLLIQAGKVSHAPYDLYLSPKVKKIICDKLTTFIPKLTAAKSWNADHWVWLEIFDSAIWIWDAEKEIPTHDNSASSRPTASDYLVAIISLNSEKKDEVESRAI